MENSTKKKQRPEDKWPVIATKVTPWANALIEGLCSRRGLVKYNIAQMVYDVLIRYMDDRHNLTPELQRLMLLFEKLEGWGQAFNLADPNTKPDVTAAIYFINDGGGTKRGARAVMVLRPFFGKAQETLNLADITDTFFSLAHPMLHRRLTELAKESDCAGPMEFINKMLDEWEDDRATADIREMFEDCMRADNGRPVQYGNRSRRTMRYDMDNMPTFFDLEGYQQQREEPPAGLDGAFDEKEP